MADGITHDAQRQMEIFAGHGLARFIGLPCDLMTIVAGAIHGYQHEFHTTSFDGSDLPRGSIPFWTLHS